MSREFFIQLRELTEQKSFGITDLTKLSSWWLHVNMTLLTWQQQKEKNQQKLILQWDRPYNVDLTMGWFAMHTHDLSFFSMNSVSECWMCLEFYCSACFAASAFLLIIHELQLLKKRSHFHLPFWVFRVSPASLPLLSVHKQQNNSICYFYRCVVIMKSPNPTKCPVDCHMQSF